MSGLLGAAGGPPAGRLARLSRRFADFLAEKYWRGGLEIRSLPPGQRVVAWLAIGAIAANVVLLIAYQAFADLTQPSVEYATSTATYLVPLAAFYLAAAVYAVGWALLITGAAFANALVFGVVALYCLVYFTPFGFSLAAERSPFFALPALLALALGPVTVSHSEELRSWRRPLALLGLGAVDAFALIVILSADPLRGLVPAAARLGVGTALGLVLAVAVLKYRRSSARRLPILAVAAISLATTGAFAGLSVAAASPEESLANALLSFEAVLPFIGIFWFYLGASALQEALSLTDLVLDSLTILASRRVVLALAVVVWLLEVAFWPQLPIGEALLQTLGWDLPIGAWLTIDAHVWMGVLALGTTAALAWRRALSGRALGIVLGIWLLSWLLFYTYFANLLGMGEVGTGFQAMALAVFAIGIYTDLYKGGASFANGRSAWFPRPARVLLYLGMLLLAAAISHLELAAQLPSFAQTAALASLDGAVYLGVPLVLYSVLSRQQAFPSFPGGALSGLFAGGALASLLGFLARGLVGLDGSSAGLAAVLVVVGTQEALKLAVLLALGATLKRLGLPLAVMVASVAAGLGAATMIVHPVAPIPFVPLEWQGVEPGAVPFDWARSLFVYLGQLGTAVGLGYAVSRVWLGRGMARVGRAAALGGALILAVVCRAAYILAFTSWEEYLYSTGLVWLFDCLPLLIVCPVLVWALAPSLPALAGARRRIMAAGVGLALLGLAIGSVLAYQGRMIARSVPGEIVIVEFPASWQEAPAKVPVVASFEHRLQFGRATAVLSEQDLPDGTTLDQFIAAAEAELGRSTPSFRLVEQAMVRDGDLRVERRMYRWQVEGDKGETTSASAQACFFLAGRRGYVIWAQATRGYEQELKWDILRVGKSIRVR